MRARDVVNLFGSATVGACEHRLDCEIRWVHTTDLPDPGRYLRGGELVLTSGLWHRKRSDVTRFVVGLAERGVPALGFAPLPGSAIPDGLAEACTEHEILLIVLPDMPFRDITEVVMTHVLAERHDAMVRDGPVAKELGLRLADGEGVLALTEVLTREAEAPCWILFRDGQHAGEHAPRSSERQWTWRKSFAMVPPRGGVTELRAASAEHVTVGPIQFEQISGKTEATAMLVCHAGLVELHPRLDNLLRLAEQYLPVADDGRLERQRGSQSAVSAVLKELLQGSVDGTRAMRQLWPDEPHRQSSTTYVVMASNEGHKRLTADTLGGCLRGAALDSTPVTGDLDGHAVGVLTHAELSAAELAESVWHAAAELVGGSALVGVSVAPAGGEALRRAVVEAANARQVAGYLDGGRRWATGREAGSHVLLLAGASRDALQSLHMTTLEPLIRYDEHNGTRLLETLAVFLTAGSWQRAAETLYVHVNSLRYRITRIEELTGRRIATIEDKADFFLALKARSLSAPDGLQRQSGLR